MRFIFIFTNAASPRTDVVFNVTSITFSTIGDREAITVAGTKEGVIGSYIFYKEYGQPAIMWE